MSYRQALVKDLYSKNNMTISVLDAIKIYFNTQKSTDSIPIEVLEEIRDQQVHSVLGMYLIVSIMSACSVSLVYLLYPLRQVEPFELWVTACVCQHMYMAFVFLYASYLKKQNVLSYQRFSSLLLPEAVLGGVLLGSLPYLCMLTNSMHLYYAGIIVMSTIVLMSFFWMFTFWHLGFVFAFITLVVFVIFDVVGQGPSALLAPYSIFYGVCVLFVSVMICRIVTSLHLNQLLQEHKTGVISLMLREFEEGAQDWIWETDSYANLIYVPDNMKAASHESEYIEEHMPFINIFKPGVLSTLQLEKKISKKEPFNDLMMKVDSKTDAVYWSISGNPVFSNNGTFIGYRGIGSDVTLKEQLKLVDASHERHSTIVRMTGSVAHDFNNVLASVMGSIELSMLKIGPSSEAKPFLEQGLQGCLHARDIISNLLSFTRQDVALEASSFNAEKVVHAVISESKLANKKNIDVTFECEDDAHVYADQLQFARAFRNLIDNAFHASQENSSVQVHVSVRNLSEYPNMEYLSQIDNNARFTVVSISDQGTGIPDEAVMHIFEPFYTTKRHDGGFGLGLSMAHGFARQSQGDLLLKSNSSKGATFELWLPLGRDYNESSIESVGVIQAHNVLTRDSTILVLEDNPLVAESIKSFLRTLNVKVIVVESLASARKLSLPQLNAITCVLCDVILGDGRGMDFITDIRQEGINTPVLYMSGFSDVLPDELSNDEKAPFISKPFKFNELVAAIEKVVSA